MIDVWIQIEKLTMKFCCKKSSYKSSINRSKQLELPLVSPIYFVLQFWLVFHSYWSPIPYRPLPIRLKCNESKFEKVVENQVNFCSEMFKDGFERFFSIRKLSKL